MNYAEFILLWDHYGGAQMQEITGMSRRALYYWRSNGFPKQVENYIKLSAKWEQLKDKLDPTGSRRMNPSLSRHQKNMKLERFVREAQEKKLRAKRKRNETFMYKRRSKKLAIRRLRSPKPVPPLPVPERQD